MQKKKLTLGIDFDGTLVTDAFPEVGVLNHKVACLVRLAYEAGHTIIIWTCRTGKHAEDAKETLANHNVPYHYFNENPEDPWYKAGINGRKIFCDFYLDDRAINVADVDKLYEVI